MQFAESRRIFISSILGLRCLTFIFAMCTPLWLNCISVLVSDCVSGSVGVGLEIGWQLCTSTVVSKGALLLFLLLFGLQSEQYSL